MSHRPHPDVHVYGLADNCDACEEISARPIRNGDDAMLTRWIAEATKTTRSFNVSVNELVAVKNVLDTFERFGRLAQVSPNLTLGYLRDRWRVDLSKVPPA